MAKEKIPTELQDHYLHPGGHFKNRDVVEAVDRHRVGGNQGASVPALDIQRMVEIDELLATLPDTDPRVVKLISEVKSL